MSTRPPISHVPVELPDGYRCPVPQKPDISQSPTIDKAAYFIARHFGGRPGILARSRSVVQYDPYDLDRWFEPSLFVAMTWGYSPALGLFPCWNPAWDWDADDRSNLRFYNHKTKRYLCDMTLVERELAALQELRKLRAIWRPAETRIVRLLDEQIRRQQP